jgi:hypothetical protein
MPALSSAHCGSAFRGKRARSKLAGRISVWDREFVSTNSAEAVLERAGEDAELAAALREGEESRGDKARKGMIEGLSKIENPEG